MQKTFFTHKEVNTKIGHQVEAAADFPSVPKGSRGTVIKAERRNHNHWVACVEWDVLFETSHFEAMVGYVSLNFFRRRKPVTDQFCKSEYDALLKSISF